MLNRRRHKTQIKCKDCGQQFRSEAALAIHMESHRKPEFACDRCTQQFLTENELELHKLDHEERDKRHQMAKEMEQRENAHECKICKRKFRTEKSYQIHMQEHKEEADQRKECPKCFKLFMSERSLEAHFTQVMLIISEKSHTIILRLILNSTSIRSSWTKSRTSKKALHQQIASMMKNFTKKTAGDVKSVRNLSIQKKFMNIICGNTKMLINVESVRKGSKCYRVKFELLV